MRKQTLIWTAIPNGRYNSDFMQVSVFLSPRLETDLDGSEPPLSYFPDFVNWPQTIGPAPAGTPISFEVKIGTHSPVPARIVNTYLGQPTPLDPVRWPLVFNEAQTGVKQYDFTDYSSYTTHTFNHAATRTYIEEIYQSFGLNNPTAPPVMTGGPSGGLNLPPGSPVASAVAKIKGVSYGNVRVPTAINNAVAYYNRPAPAQPDTTPWVSSLPTLDFHAAISALASYPALLRMFGLVFDLLVPTVPANGLLYSTVSVIPKFTSAFPFATTRPTSLVDSTINVTPNTAVSFVGGGFRPRPLGTEDYLNGMLDLADTARFSVTELDVDGGAQNVNTLAGVLASVNTFLAGLGGQGSGQTMALSLPSLRSTGPAVVRTGWAKSLQALTARQTASQNRLENYLNGTTNALPLFAAEDVIRGHRFDVLTASEATPAWRSLHQRAGQFSFGEGAGPDADPVANAPLTFTDEGAVVPGASQAAGVPNPPTDLYIHEEIARWAGWSLSAPRVGRRIDTDDSPQDANRNPAAPTDIAGQAPDAADMVTPQISATFTVPPGTLPKLRYGNAYQVRARGVDLAGNGPAVTSTDVSTATPPFIHLRYDPVVAPVVTPTSPLTPGQGALVVALLNDGVNPIVPVGRWLFPPKVAELLVEEHGMLDGFMLGQPPNPNAAPDGTDATYKLIVGDPANNIVGLDQGTLETITGIEADPVTGTPFLPTPSGGSTPAPTTPWFPDPLAAGAAMVGLPTDPVGAATVRPWAPGPWPALNPLLLELQPGASSSHSFAPATGGQPATETVVLSPADVHDVQVSSSITNYSLMGVWQWILGGLPSYKVAQFQQLAANGQIWLLSPYTTVRIAHAVRQPLSAPVFSAPTYMLRSYGSTKANLYDIKFMVDGASTATVSVEASWADPLDDPTDDRNDPTTATTPFTQPAFKLNVPDPKPELAVSAPGNVVAAPTTFALTSQPGVTHDIGDTKHHYMNYVATGTSRFAEFFRSEPAPFVASTSAIALSDKKLGLDPGSVRVLDPQGNDVPDTEFTVDPIGGTLTFNAGSAYLGDTVEISFIPTVTLPGPADSPAGSSLHVLSSARPKPPKIKRVAPAWITAGPLGKPKSGIFYGREGGFIRVYLDRPWFSSGANEMLGVVTLPRELVSAQPPPDQYGRLVTLMGLDPISLADPTLHFPTTPQYIQGTATLPKPIVGRPAYTSPPRLPLAEDASNTLYNIYPFEVQFDPNSNLWWADIQLKFFTPDIPPPGYFVRLALVRFQPYSISGAEVSPVSLATFTQPVSDRSVVVLEATPNSVYVEVQGPAYKGFRPVTPGSDEAAPGNLAYDYLNDFAPTPYSSGIADSPFVTSAMVAEIQLQNLDSGLGGDLAWQAYDSIPPVQLLPSFNNGIVTWSGELPLAYTIGTTTQQRIRISEIDYYTGSSAPTTVDTTYRRPFITHIPI